MSWTAKADVSVAAFQRACIWGPLPTDHCLAELAARHASRTRRGGPEGALKTWKLHHEDKGKGHRYHEQARLMQRVCEHKC